MKKIAVVKVLEEIQSSEVYIADTIKEVYPELDPDDDWYNEYELEHHYPNNSWYEGDDMPITEVEDILTKLKSKGCTHVSIIHHQDHNNHVFNGSVIEKADSDYYKNKKEEEQKRIASEIHRYQNIIDNLKRKLDEQYF